MPGFLVALIAKLAGLGTVAKGAIATTTAALTIVVGGGAANVLPLPGGQTDTGVVAQAAIDQATAAVSSAANSLPPATSGGTGVQAASGVAVTTPTGSTSARASTGVASPTPSARASTGAGNPTTSANLPTAPNVAVPTIPSRPAVPSCVANLIPTGATVPDPAKLVAQLPPCILSVVAAHLPLDIIQSAIGSANLPVNVSKCLSAVLRETPTFVGGDLSGLRQLLSACLPAGSIPGMGSIPGIGSIPGTGSIPGVLSGR